MRRVAACIVGTVVGTMMFAASAPAQDGCFCIELYDPVCGSDGKTYSNACKALCAGVEVTSKGECAADPFEYCKLVNCGINEDPVCGVDGRTYGNKCKAECIGGVAVQYDGPCLVEEKPEIAAFPDTSRDSEEGQAALDLRKRGIIQGYPDGTFGGGRPVNRAEAAKFLLLACERSQDAPYSGRFPDVPPDAWFTPFVEAAAAQNIIAGHPDGTFRPANTVNRAEFSKMFANACYLKPEMHSRFWMDVSPDDWFSTYVGAIEPYSPFLDTQDGYLHPSHLMTRKEVAIAIVRYLERK